MPGSTDELHKLNSEINTLTRLMGKLYRHVTNIQGILFPKKWRKKIVFQVSYLRNKFSVPLHMEQWMTNCWPKTQFTHFSVAGSWHKLFNSQETKPISFPPPCLIPYIPPTSIPTHTPCLLSNRQAKNTCLWHGSASLHLPVRATVASTQCKN